MRRSSVIVASLVIAACQMEFALACPTCKDGLAESGQAGLDLARGFELSIYLMLAVPMVLFACLAFVFTRQVKKADSTGRHLAFQQMVAAVEQSGRSLPPSA
ncbi:MAG: hypothetical protein U0892_23625 [Pirellulales bacterium]